MAVTTEAPPSDRVGTARTEAAAGVAAPTAVPEVEEEVLEVVAMLGAAEPPARGAAARGDTATPRAAATEATVNTHTEAATE